jgi:acyl-CoA synthetase (AMP-forming)/AMP-acid ligase II
LSREDKLLAKTALCDHFFEQYSSSISGRITELAGEDLLMRAETVGRVLPHVNLQIVDHAGEIVPAGTPGIIRVRSPTMASAIYGGGERTTGDRLKDGWAYTGDVGAVDEEGFLTLHGREADVIVRSGVNIHPSEIEAAISAIPGVREAIVVGFAAPREGEEIAAFVVTDGTVNEATIGGRLRSVLAQDRHPRKLVIVDSLPRNANGKVVRAELRARLEGTG